jgi:hypothetical protein
MNEIYENKDSYTVGCGVYFPKVCYACELWMNFIRGNIMCQTLQNSFLCFNFFKGNLVGSGYGA